MKWWLFYCLMILAPMIAAQNFISVEGTEFYLDGKPYNFIGTNFWYGMNLGALQSGDRDRLIRELDQLTELGVTNLRIMAGSEGPDGARWRVEPSLQYAPLKYNDDILGGLDFLLAEMGKRNMYAVVCLNNFWPWTGGMAQYQAWTDGSKIPYPPPASDGNWIKYMLYTAKFYSNKKAKELFSKHVKSIVTRVNKLTQKPYYEDPTIMSWQLANEPRGIAKGRHYRSWIRQTANQIKQLDHNHLVSIGSEGNTPSRLSGNRFTKDHGISDIDYTTIHIWVQNWMWFDPLHPEEAFEPAIQKAYNYYKTHLKIAQSLNKPLVLEEFGMSRDLDDHDPRASTKWRDRYFQRVIDWMSNPISGGTLAGCNFWAWGGVGRPDYPKAIWKKGADLIGDPPHEYQGWYSVYDSDQSTIQIIKEANEVLSKRH